MQRVTRISLLLAFLLAFTVSVASAADPIAYWWRYGGLQDEEQEWLDQVTAEQGINVELTKQGSYYDKVKIGLATGEGPDMYVLTSLVLPEFVDGGFLKNVAPYYKRDVNSRDLFEPVINGMRYGEDPSAIWAMPINYNIAVMYYNKAIFDDAGMAYPDNTWTWETYSNYAKKLTYSASGDELNKIYGYGIDKWSYFQDIYPAIQSNGGAILTPDRKNAAINNPVAVQTLRFFADMVLGGTATLDRNIMETGKTAMWVQGTPKAKTYLAANIDIGMAILPKGSERRVVYGISDALGMAPSAKDPKVTWELMKQSTLKRPVDYYAKTGWFPLEKKLAGSPELGPLFAEQGIDYSVILQSANYMDNTASLNWNSWQKDVRVIFDKVFAGELPPEQAVAEAELAINNWLHPSN